MLLQVKKGDAWAGGIDKPFIASWEAIAQALKGMSIDLVDHFERGERPLPFDPKRLKPYSDDWDNVALVKVRKSQEIDLPDRIKWVRLMDRIAPTLVSANPVAELAGVESGLARDLAAEAASRRARERRSRGATLVAVGLVASGVVVPGAIVLARRARRQRY